MKTITSTELARNLRQVLDNLLIDGQEVEIERNNERIARLVPGPRRQTAMEAMSDLYRTLPEDAATGWLKDAREHAPAGNEVRDPWAS